MKRADRGDAGSVSGTAVPGFGFRVPGRVPGSWFLVGSTFGNRRNPPGTKQRGARNQTWNVEPETWNREQHVCNPISSATSPPPRPRPHTCRSLSECGRARFDEIVGQQDLLGPGRPLAGGHRARSAPVDDPVGPAGDGEDDAGAARRRADQGALRVVQRRARGYQGHQGGDGRGRGGTPHAGPAHDPVRGRDPPLQQGAAGRVPAARRGGLRSC